MKYESQSQITIHFCGPHAAKAKEVFWGWLLDGGGEQQFWESGDIHAPEIGIWNSSFDIGSGEYVVMTGEKEEP